MEQKHEVYEFTYSAKQQEKMKQILQKYVPKEENKMEQLRRLDKVVSDRGLICSLTAGVIGIAVAYPLNHYVVKKQREKIAPQIVALTNELLSR